MANFADLTSQGAEQYSSAALENTASITTAQSLLFVANGRNTDTTNGIFIMVFDLATTPISSSVPKIVIGVPAAGTTAATLAAGNWSLSASYYGVKFKLGIQIAASSTDGITYTSIATNKTFFHVEFSREDGVSAL